MDKAPQLMDKPIQPMDQPLQSMDRPPQPMDQPLQPMDRPPQLMDQLLQPMDKPSRPNDKPPNHQTKLEHPQNHGTRPRVPSCRWLSAALGAWLVPAVSPRPRGGRASFPPLLWPAAGSAVLGRPRGSSMPGVGAGLLGVGAVATVVAAVVAAVVVVMVVAAAVVKMLGSVLLSRESSSPVGPQTMTSGSAVGRPSRGAKPRPRSCRRARGRGMGGGRRARGAQGQGGLGRRGSSLPPVLHSTPRGSLCRCADRGERRVPAGSQLARSMARWNMAINIQAWLPSGQPDLRADTERVRKQQSADGTTNPLHKLRSNTHQPGHV